MEDSHGSVLASARRFFSGTLLSRITGLGRDMAMAAAFGSSSSVAAFLVAFRLSQLLRRLLGEGALQTAFAPCFESLRAEDPARAAHFFRALTRSLSGLLLLIIFLAEIGLLTALWRGHWSSGTRELLILTALLVPGCLCTCLYGLNASLLQCERRYFTPSVAPALFNIVMMVGMAIAATSSGPMRLLSLFCVAGLALEWLVTLIPAIRSTRPHLSLPSTSKGDLRRLLKPLGLGILGVGGSVLSNALDPLFARIADPSGPAYLWYALRLQQLPLALFGLAIAGAALPPLCRAIQDRDSARYQSLLAFALRRTWSLMVPLTLFLILFAPATINLTYGRGDFSPAAVSQTAACLQIYALALLPTALTSLLASAWYAQGQFRFPMLASLTSVAASILWNSLAVLLFHAGPVAIAWATTVSATINCIWLLIPLLRQHPLTQAVWPTILRSALATTIAALTAYYLPWQASTLTRGFVSQLLDVAIPGLAFGLTLLLASRLAGERELLGTLGIKYKI